MSKLTIFGKQELDRELDADKDLSVAFLEMRIKKIEIDKSDDSKHYKVENLGEVIIKQDGEAFKGAKDLWKAKMRYSMLKVHEDLNIEEPFESWRTKIKNQMPHYMPEIVDLIIKLSK